MRLVRGAGVFGLAAMRPAIRTAGITIARPLLDLPRAGSPPPLPPPAFSRSPIR